MYGLNIDPRNPHGSPDPTKLRTLGVEIVRYTFKVSTTKPWLDPNTIDFYRAYSKALAGAGIRSLIVLAAETYPNWRAFAGADRTWAHFITIFAERAAEIAKLLAPWRPAFQIWHTPDANPDQVGADNALHEIIYGQLLTQTYQAIKAVDKRLPVVTGGLISGQPGWLTAMGQALDNPLPADAIALHLPPNLYPKAAVDLITAYGQVVDLPVWVTEVGSNAEDEVQQATYLQRFYQIMAEQFFDKVKQVFWCCYADGMASAFGLVDNGSRPKLAYSTYQKVTGATAAIASAAPAAKSTVPLDRLHTLAQYLEQNIVFGEFDRLLQAQLDQELRGNTQQLSRIEIWQLTRRMLAGSSGALGQFEIDALAALQPEKDLLGMLRAIILATHQQTGALTGRVGPHVRISAETDANAITNIEAVMRVLSLVQIGNRMIVMDAVKATADENKLRGPDIFETNIYGQHRNGLIDNHAWNLQRLVRAIRDRGYQERVLLIIRVDGPDEGANVNVFNPASLEKYRLALAKLIRYLETVLPLVPFKIVLGNEPDLVEERGWSDPQVDPKIFTIEQFAPAKGAFMKEIARQRPDVTFICPAISANLKEDHLAYYLAFFAADRPANLIPAMHGYAADVTEQPGDRKNLIEWQAQALREQGQFMAIAGTEIGSGNPFGDIEALSEKSKFSDVVAWLLLSTEHHAPPGQDNNWSFRISPTLDDLSGHQLSQMINRSEARVLRNIVERTEAQLQIIQNHAGSRPQYAVDYIEHDTPIIMTTGETQPVQITLRNTSQRTWPTTGPYPVRLGYHWYTVEGAVLPAELWIDHRTQLPYDLLPGNRVTLTATLAAPYVSGHYEVRWDMVEELRTWFAWQGVPTLDVPVAVGIGPLTEAGLSLKSSHNNVLSGADNLSQAFDENPQTRWSSRAVQQPGMWVEIDLGERRSVNRLHLANDASPQDYPRGYVVKVATDRQHWVTVAENPTNSGPLDVRFAAQPVRYLRVEQTGADPNFWWSIHEIEMTEVIGLSLSSSHNNVLSGADNLSQAFDENPQTRWSSRAVQQPGMWLEIDLNEARIVSGLTLDSTASPFDYPRGYVVQLSTDRNVWVEVARAEQNEGNLEVEFSPQPARYVRVEQTAQSDRWWWSVHEVVVKFGETVVTPALRASHNNVLSGADSLSQALDGIPNTRWSSRAVQQPGMWLEIDLNEARIVSGLTLDSTASPFDYPRGYVVQLSTDRNVWVEVARAEQNEGNLEVEFSPQPARYVRVEQTAQSDRWWWSVHEVIIKG